MKRLWATAWAFAILLPFALADGFPTADWLLIYAAIVFALGASRWRLPLRAGLVVLALVFGIDLAGAGALTALGAVVPHLSPAHWGELSRSQGVVLFEVAAVVVTTVFEQRSSGFARLVEFIIGVAALAVAQEAGAAVVPFIAAFLALTVPVVRTDRTPAHEPAMVGGMWLFSGALALIACLIVFSLPHTRVAFAFQTGGASSGVPLDPSNLNAPVTESTKIVFTATSTVDSYWRVFSADTYTGQGWSHQLPQRDYLPGYLQMPNPFGSSGGEGVATVHLRTTLGEDPSPGIAMGPLYPAGEGASHSWIIDLSGDGFYVPQKTSYTVLFGYPSATPEELAVAQSASGPAADLAVPRNIAPRLHALALQIVAGVGPNPYARVKAIAAWLDSHEQYTLSMPSDGGHNFVTYFLFTSHQGDCNAFSTALALMARTLGIPTRWVVGYTPGKVGPHRYEVLASDAHSWVEVNYAGFGWVPIDPTPGFLESVTLPPTRPGSGSTQGIQPESAGKPTQIGHEKVPPGVRRNLPSGPASGSRAHARDHGGTSPWVGLTVLVLALAAAREAVSLRRPAGLMAATRLTGRPWRRGMTIREWLGGEAPALQEMLERRIYGVGVVTSRERAEAGRELRRLLFESRRLGGALGVLMALPWPE